MKEINFDMDGTLANFYGYPEWLSCLQNEDTLPYEIAEPLFNFSVLARVLNRLHKEGWKINIISWTSKTGAEDFNDEIAGVKLDWLAEHLPSVKFDNISIIPYGTPKSLYGNGILFDDEDRNRSEWNGTAYDVDNILEILKNL